MTTEPYNYTDPDGDTLSVSATGAWLRVEAVESDNYGGVPVLIAASDVREVTAVMLEKAGLPDRWAALKDIIFCLRPDGMSGEAYRRFVVESMGRLEAGQ
jgi:hypothetical protein